MTAFEQQWRNFSAFMLEPESVEVMSRFRYASEMLPLSANEWRDMKLFYIKKVHYQEHPGFTHLKGVFQNSLKNVGETLRLPYEGRLLPSTLHDEFHRRYHCPTGFSLTSLDYEETEGDPASRVEVVLLGNPTKPGPNLNSCDTTLHPLPCQIEAQWRMKPSTDESILGAVAAMRLKGGPIRQIGVASDFLSVEVPYDSEAKVNRTEIVIRYGSSFHQRSNSHVDAHCDVCFAKTSSEENAILLCDRSAPPERCAVGRHRLCFKKSVSLEEVASMHHLCLEHTVARKGPQRAARDRAGTGASNSVPRTNAPELSSITLGLRRSQALLPGKQWQEGLRYNAGQLATRVAISTIPESGLGLFLEEDRLPLKADSREEPLGWMWGSIVTADRFAELISNMDYANDSAATPEERAFVHDWANGIRRAITIEETLATASETYMLLVSRQCPMGCMNDSRDDPAVLGAQCTLRWPNGWVETEQQNMHHQTFPVFAPRGFIQAKTELFFSYGWSAQEWKHAVPGALPAKVKHPRAHGSRAPRKRQAVEDAHGHSTAAARRQQKAKEQRHLTPLKQPDTHSAASAASTPESCRRVRDSPERQIKRSTGASTAHVHDGRRAQPIATAAQTEVRSRLQRMWPPSPIPAALPVKRGAEAAFGVVDAAPVSSDTDRSPMRVDSPEFAVRRTPRLPQPGGARRSLASALDAGVQTASGAVRAARASTLRPTADETIDLTSDALAAESQYALMHELLGREPQGSASYSEAQRHSATSAAADDEAFEADLAEYDDYGNHMSDADESFSLEDEYHPPENVYPASESAPSQVAALSSSRDAAASTHLCVAPPRIALSKVKRMQPLRRLKSLQELKSDPRFSPVQFSPLTLTAITALYDHFNVLTVALNRPVELDVSMCEAQFSAIRMCCGQETLLAEMRARPGHNTPRHGEHAFDSPQQMLTRRLADYTHGKMEQAIWKHFEQHTPNVHASVQDPFSRLRVYSISGVPTCINCLTCLVGCCDRTVQRKHTKAKHGPVAELARASQKSGRRPDLLDTVVSFLLRYIRHCGLDEYNPTPEGAAGQHTTQVINLPFANQAELLQHLSNEQRIEASGSNIPLYLEEDAPLICQLATFGRAVNVVRTEHYLSIVVTKSKKFMRCDTCMANDFKIASHNKDPRMRSSLRKDKFMHLEQTRLERRELEKKRDLARIPSQHGWACATDGMDQSKTIIPHVRREAKSTDGTIGFKTHVVSTVIYGAPQVLMGFVNTAEIDKNYSLTVTNLHRAIEIQWETHMAATGGVLKEWPTWFHLCFDNCITENLNKYVFHYLAALILIGVFASITLGTLIVGHTHNINDQLFSVWSRYLDNHDVLTFGNLLKVFRRQYHMHVKRPAAEKNATKNPVPETKRYLPHPEVDPPAAAAAVSAPSAGEPAAEGASAGYIPLNANQPSLIELKNLGEGSQPRMEMVSQNVDVESWLGKENISDLPGMMKLHVFSFNKTAEGAVVLSAKYVSNADIAYPATPHPYLVDGVRYSKQQTIFRAGHVIDHDPRTHLLNTIDEAPIRQRIAKLTEVGFFPLRKDAHGQDIPRVTDGQGRITQHGEEQDLVDRLEALTLAVRRQGESCAVCKEVMQKLHAIGPISQMNRNLQSQEEQDALSDKTRRKRELVARKVLHLADPVFEKQHGGRIWDGWWTNWTDKLKGYAGHARVAHIMEMYRRRGTGAADAEEPECEQRGPEAGLLEHPLTTDLALIVARKRASIAAMESGPPTSGCMVLMHGERDIDNPGRPCFWLAMVLDYGSPTASELTFDSDLAAYHSAGKGGGVPCPSGDGLYVDGTGKRNPARRGDAAEAGHNSAAAMDAWNRTASKGKRQPGKKDALSKQQPNAAIDVYAHTHIAVHFYNHIQTVTRKTTALSTESIEPAPAPASAATVEQSRRAPIAPAAVGLRASSRRPAPSAIGRESASWVAADRHFQPAESEVEALSDADESLSNDEEAREVERRYGRSALDGRYVMPKGDSELESSGDEDDGEHSVSAPAVGQLEEEKRPAQKVAAKQRKRVGASALGGPPLSDDDAAPINYANMFTGFGDSILPMYLAQFQKLKYLPQTAVAAKTSVRWVAVGQIIAWSRSKEDMLTKQGAIKSAMWKTLVNELAQPLVDNYQGQVQRAKEVQDVVLDIYQH